MKQIISLICMAVLLCGCEMLCNGPTHDYYSPIRTDAPKFKGPITMQRVNDIEAAKEQYIQQRNILIGVSDYAGKFPEPCELRQQARRAHANHIVYSAEYLPPTPGSWHFGFNRFGGGGGTDSGGYNVHILFFGK